jgi:hypothetical protein
MFKRYATYAFMAALAGIVISPASAGGYDGVWVGTAPAKGDCGTLNVTLSVNGSTIGGVVSGAHGSPRIKPTMFSPGASTLEYKGFRANVTFSGSTFSGEFGTMCGPRQVVGRKT